MTYTTIYAIITNRYPEHKETLLGMLEASFGVGLIFGPFAGSTLFEIFGFQMTFFIYGSVFLIFTMLLYMCLPTIKSNPDGQPDPRFSQASDSGSSAVNKKHNKTQT